MSWYYAKSKTPKTTATRVLLSMYMLPNCSSSEMNGANFCSTNQAYWQYCSLMWTSCFDLSKARKSDRQCQLQTSYCQIWCLRIFGHAAIWSVCVASIPSLNLTPVITLVRSSKPRNFRQFCSAHCPGLNIMCNMPLRVRQPFDRFVRWRIVAKVDSIGLVVRMDCQCLAGKSKNAISSSRSFCRHIAALGYFAS